jgi:four helix bundle protein
MRDYRKLEVGRRAKELVLSVYMGTNAFPPEERYGLTAQMRRAAVSVVSNIAEGTGRGGEREFLQFLYLSLGSATELAAQVDLAIALGFMTVADGSVLGDRVNRVQRMLNRLTAHLRTKLGNGEG